MGYKRLTGWTRTPPKGDKVGAQWEHPSGWIVAHCGHPTAHFPYYLIHPKGWKLPALTFRHLEEAQGHVLRQLWQEAVNHAGTLKGGTRRQ